jgi:hypothetical protein
MPSGTSVVGSQLILDAEYPFYRLVQCELGGSISDPPSRVGFYYICLFRAGYNTNLRVIRVGGLYRPGQMIKIPHFLSGEERSLRMFVEWNESGIDWLIYATG